MNRGTTPIQIAAKGTDPSKRLTLIERPTLGSLQRERFLSFERKCNGYTIANRMISIAEVAEEKWELFESSTLPIKEKRKTAFRTQRHFPNPKRHDAVTPPTVISELK